MNEETAYWLDYYEVDVDNEFIAECEDAHVLQEYETYLIKQEIAEA
ncbi:hypothetical protein LCGC14_3021840 [marine sediment metagenome]|uniref:Uncharacterized protein n=1 Tax=marine sediment metagenome TaxID=412755 RepID=A0A0F8WVI2_9ZZZZ